MIAVHLATVMDQARLSTAASVFSVYLCKSNRSSIQVNFIVLRAEREGYQSGPPWACHSPELLGNEDGSDSCSQKRP